jgi:hypothetical protein
VDPAAARCHIQKGDIQQAKLRLDGELGPRRWAFQQPLGPRTRREFFAFLRQNAGRPG